MRFHMIDRIEEISYGKYITAVKCISLADDVFNEHFPGYPLFPGSLILEGLAQLGGAFFEMTMPQQGLPVKRAVLSIIKQFKIKQPAGPGDKLLYRAEIKSLQEDYGVVDVSAGLEGETCAQGELLFSFVELQNKRLQESRQELYAIVTKNMKVIADERPL
jgi:3-hydroxyacyl-[acyl-carrier-protein] dehydratase